MFDTEEVDDDYFTPMARTSLASIFKKPVTGEKTENETLKYTPPMPNPVQNKEEPSKKPYETVFTCVFDAYVWLDNVYIKKGKLGCAVVKHNTAEGAKTFHSILLYDSKKVTVSSAIATKELEVTVKGNNVISYYDRYEKYWCLHGSEEEVKKIINVLKSCDVNIKVLSEENNALPQHNKADHIDVKTDNTMKVESDTDSSVNRKTKASILSRMANMGQSVLPIRTVSNEQSSDSSDANECDCHLVAVRHKPVKNVIKKTIPDKNILDLHRNNDTHKKAIVTTAQHQENKTFIEVDNQIMPIQSSVTMATTSGQDLNYFFTEQRIANSELRINMTRVTDKVDNILNKVNNMEKDKSEGSAINIEIYQKLLREYENKIKVYEELLQKEKKDTSSISKQEVLIDKAVNNEHIELNNKVDQLNICIQQRDAQIADLNKEIQKLKEGNKTSQTDVQIQAIITEYEEKLNMNNAMLFNLTAEKDELIKSHDDQMEQKMKSIMNNTFRAIEINFDDEESYSGETTKNIIATVIKRVTMESLNQIK